MHPAQPTTCTAGLAQTRVDFSMEARGGDTEWTCEEELPKFHRFPPPASRVTTPERCDRALHTGSAGVGRGLGGRYLYR